MVRQSQRENRNTRPRDLRQKPAMRSSATSCDSCECSRTPIIQDKQWIIVPRLLSVEHGERPIVQNQPFPFEMYGYYRMHGLTRVVTHDQKSQIVKRNPQMVEHDVFYDCIVLAIASSAAERLKRRRPEISMTVLSPIADRPDAEVYCAIDPA